MSIIDDSDNDDSAAEDLDDLVEEFASILNIHENVGHPRPLPNRYGPYGYSHVGRGDPAVKNLGNSWVLDYTSVASLRPLNRAATILSTFYQDVVAIAAENLANGTTSTKNLAFEWNKISLSLTSPDPIPWAWVMRFAHKMSQSTNSRWTVLYNAIAKNAYWDVPVVHAALSVANAQMLKGV
ncbi:MAG: hypothetical protein Q9225_003579 [Loekoesia sp. 1 TL-2023]